MITAELLEDLKAILPEERIAVDNEQGHPLGNSGKVTVYPNSEEEIANILRYANDNGKKISVVGGGTKRGFGGIIEYADIGLSLANYKGFVEHVVGDMTLTVKAGTPVKELQEYLAPFNQKIAMDVNWPEYATIGGVIAANDSGPKRLGYGSARDAVIGLRTVYPDGTVIRSGGKVVKNVAGYDMNKLFIGSMGTLGVVSEVTLKLRPRTKYESLVLLSFPEGDLQGIRSFAVKLLDSMMEPVALELLNPSLAEKLTGQHRYTLAISFEDIESSVHYQEEFIKKIQPAQTELKILSIKDALVFWDQFYQMAPNGAADTAGPQTEAALKIGVVNLDVINVIRECQLLQDTHHVSALAHGGLGHGLCQVILEGSSDDILSAINLLRSSAEQLGGYAVVKHLPFSLRQKVNVWGEKPAHYFLLEGIKKKIDPNRILNPGRFVGGI
ncbi:FAD-binding oxidoreductase [Neobacillus niacini]|uniref:FAD-binding oxidoreductase n=1 Tax=Neobacillus niacini TaxID=86668 RepID=UPI0021CB0966|nr:FAD-binding oxidoreductase [Neobacillus niacini]MCM3766907.1 FAD-binding oxidoreductase [Neobacillus niacini]